MKRLSRLTTALAVVLATGAVARASDLAANQERLYQALKSQRLVSGDTQLVRMNYVCTLLVGAKSWLVVDAIEFVRGAEIPRASSHILLLDERLKLIKAFDYATQQPLFCTGDKLYLRGDYGVGNEEPYGNTLQFSPNGDVTVSKTELDALPVPATAKRGAFQLK